MGNSSNSWQDPAQKSSQITGRANCQPGGPTVQWPQRHTVRRRTRRANCSAGLIHIGCCGWWRHPVRAKTEKLLTSRIGPGAPGHWLPHSRSFVRSRPKLVRLVQIAVLVRVFSSHDGSSIEYPFCTRTPYRRQSSQVIQVIHVVANPALFRPHQPRPCPPLRAAKSHRPTLRGRCGSHLLLCTQRQLRRS